MTEKLNTGDQFPSLTLPLHGGGELTLPESNDASYQIILTYRGSF